MSPSAAEPLPDFLVDLAQSSVVTAEAVAKLSLRYEYLGTEPLLAHMASAGVLTIEQIDRAAQQAGSQQDVPAATLSALNSSGVYALAFLALGRIDDGATATRAADLFALGRKVAAHHGTPLEYVDVDLQANLAAGRGDYVRQNASDKAVDPWISWSVETDLTNPLPAASGTDVSNWLQTFNRPFDQRGIAPVRIRDTATPFDSVTTDAVAQSVSGPSVTIVMPVWSPSASLVTAVSSVLEQTWRNLEVILVDDASPAGFESVFAEAVALDPRVTYVRMPTNGGAYRARNHGVSLAKSEYVGFQDADDWSHPQRVERQMAVLQERPDVIATLSKAIRVHADLRITKTGSLPFEKNAPSLLFRRQPVLDRLGRYDDMRKAADTEFIERLAAVFGPDNVVTLEEPLALYQLTTGSLSRADFRTGWHRDARVSYHSAFRYWHRQIVEEGADPVIESANGRAFPAPPEFEGVDYPHSRLDVVMLADWRHGLVDHTALATEIRAMASAGLKVGLVRGEAIRHAKVKRNYPRRVIQQALAAGHASWSPFSADLSASLLLVRDPDLLAFARPTSSIRMRPQRIVVVADRTPRPDHRPRTSYDPATIERAAVDTFGITVEWLPTTAQIALQLRESGATGTIHPAHRLDVVDVERFPARPTDQRPVIGVADASRFGVERIDRARLASVLPLDDSYDVRLFENSPRPRTYPGATWLQFDNETLTAAAFFDQCDFYVGLPPRVHGTRLVRPILDAMARGCVPIVDPELREVLGDAALYYGQQSVAEIVDRVWDDPGLLTAQQQRSIAFCHNELAAAVFASAITQLTATGSSL